MRLKGKTALVTAAGAGIGRASALAFAREGATVIATDVDAASLATLAEENLSIRTERLDVTDASAIEALSEKTQDVNVLMYCAGYVHLGSVVETTDAEWSRSIDVNLTGLFRVTRAWLPHMVAKGGGSIVNVASVASSIRHLPTRAAYAATKAGVIGLTKAIAGDFASKGVRCNAICPGTMDSPSFAERLRRQGDEATARAAVSGLIPLGRVGRLEEAAALAVYLASDEAAYTTGALHVIDGGLAN